jgi:hypothetical protein
LGHKLKDFFAEELSDPQTKSQANQQSIRHLLLLQNIERYVCKSPLRKRASKWRQYCQKYGSPEMY